MGSHLNEFSEVGIAIPAKRVEACDFGVGGAVSIQKQRGRESMSGYKRGGEVSQCCDSSSEGVNRKLQRVRRAGVTR